MVNMSLNKEKEQSEWNCVGEFNDVLLKLFEE